MKYFYQGVTDDITECWQCGRTHLKSTVCLKDENNNFVYFGSECAVKALKWTQKQLKEEIKREQNKKEKDKEELLKKARIQYNNHPNIIKVNCEIAEANRNNLIFIERREKGLITKWKELKLQAKKEILIRFNLPNDTIL